MLSELNELICWLINRCLEQSPRPETTFINRWSNIASKHKYSRQPKTSGFI